MRRFVQQIILTPPVISFVFIFTATFCFFAKHTYLGILFAALEALFISFLLDDSGTLRQFAEWRRKREIQSMAEGFPSKSLVNTYFVLCVINVICFLYFGDKKYFAFVGHYLAPLWYAPSDQVSVYPLRFLIILLGIIFLPGTIAALIGVLIVAVVATIALVPIAVLAREPNGLSVLLSIGGFALFVMLIHKFKGGIRMIVDVALLSLFSRRRAHVTHKLTLNRK
jgi:hypothetical protein